MFVIKYTGRGLVAKRPGILGRVLPLELILSRSSLKKFLRLTSKSPSPKHVLAWPSPLCHPHLQHHLANRMHSIMPHFSPGRRCLFLLFAFFPSPPSPIPRQSSSPKLPLALKLLFLVEETQPTMGAILGGIWSLSQIPPPEEWSDLHSAAISPKSPLVSTERLKGDVTRTFPSQECKPHCQKARNPKKLSVEGGQLKRCCPTSQKGTEICIPFRRSPAYLVDLRAVKFLEITHELSSPLLQKESGKRSLANT